MTETSRSGLAVAHGVRPRGQFLGRPPAYLRGPTSRVYRYIRAQTSGRRIPFGDALRTLGHGAGTGVLAVDPCDEHLTSASSEYASTADTSVQPMPFLKWSGCTMYFGDAWNGPVYSESSAVVIPGKVPATGTPKPRRQSKPLP